MSREWQQTKLTNYVMPNAVYYQSIWAVRDLCRMEERLKELEEQSCSFVHEGQWAISAYDSNMVHPREKDILARRVEDIRGALESIPLEYRNGILHNIIDRDAGIGNPEEWRFWKQKFLYNVARNLSLL